MQGLNEADWAVAELVYEGYTNREISERLSYAEHSVWRRVHRLYEWFGVEHAARVRLAWAIHRHLELRGLMGE